MTTRKKKSAINMLVGVFIQTEIALIGILNRRFFIQNLSIDYLGCNAVFVNILEILSLVCCGSFAISFLMIKAIASDDVDEVRKVFKINHIYHWITCGLLVLIGAIASFFLSKLLQNSTGFEWGFLQIVYLLFLADLCIANLSGLSGSPGYYDIIIKCAQDSAVCYAFYFIVTNIYMVGQCAVLFYTKNYLLYLITALFSKVIYIFLTRMYCFRHFPYLKGRIQVTYKQIKETNLFAEIRNNIAIMIAKVIFNGTDNIVITGFLGITVSGLYSNYQTIYNQLRNLIGKFINGMSMSVADYIHRTNNEEGKMVLFYNVQFLCGSVGLICSCCFFSLAQPFITLFFGEGLLLDTIVVFVISIMLFLNVLGTGSAMFRHAMGKYWLDRNYQLMAAAVNLGISLLLVRKIGLTGILLGTISGILVTFQGYLKVIKNEAIETFDKRKWWLEVLMWIVLMTMALLVAQIGLYRIEFSVFGMLVCLLGALIISIIFIVLLCFISKRKRLCAVFYINQAIDMSKKISNIKNSSIWKGEK